jgi:5-methylthioadenosine/S-adenosylhomocysteine deaminase
MRERGLSVVTNPASNAKLASGIAPITAYMEAGINVGIGTDSAASNNCLDMFREMFLVTALGKLKDMDASSIDAAEVLKMATVNGAHAMGLNDSDIIAPGKKADIILLDLQQPNMQPINNIVKNIVYSGSKSNVVMTMIGGIIRYEKGSFNIGAEPSDIYSKAEEISKRLYS